MRINTDNISEAYMKNVQLLADRIYSRCQIGVQYVLKS